MLPRDIELEGLLEVASTRFRSRGLELFRLRSVALKLTTVLGLLGIWIVQNNGLETRAITLAVLAVFALPSALCAPGLAAGTLAVARDQSPRGVILQYAYRSLDVGLLALVRGIIVIPLGLLSPILGVRAGYRLSMAEFIMIDGPASLFGALRRSLAMTEGFELRMLVSGIYGSLDSLTRYGLIRAELDGRVRHAIFEALCYDFLVSRRDDSNNPLSLAPPVPHPTKSAVTRQAPPVPTRSAQPSTPPRPVQQAASQIRPEHPCPRCDGELTEHDEETYRLMACSSRHGVWIDNRASHQLAQGQFSPRAIEFLSRLEAGASPLEDVPRRLHCPMCSSPMQRNRVEVGLLMVDVCEEHGTWFDTGELRRVADGFQKAQQDREEIRELLARPEENRYLRGLRVMRDEFVDGAVKGARTAVDSTVAGTERERDEMWLRVLSAAIRIVTK